MKRCRQNPGWYLRIDEGIWKDNEQNFDDIQGSMKDDKKLRKIYVELQISSKKYGKIIKCFPMVLRDRKR